MTPSTRYRSTTAANLAAAGKPRPRWPLLGKGNTTPFLCYAFEQDFQCALASVFPPPALNTPSNTGTTFVGLADGNAILTKITQPSNVGDGQVKVTCSFVRVPAPWDDFQTQNVTFPGIRDTGYQGGVRDPKPLSVTTRIHRDYFTVDPLGTLDGETVKDSGGANNITVVPSIGSIPSIYRTPWKFLVSGAVLSTSEVTGLVKAGGQYPYLETVPNSGTYQAWIGVAAAFNANVGAVPWDATHPPVWDGTATGGPPTTIGQYCFQDSKLQIYEGNVWERLSFYVLAQ